MRSGGHARCDQGCAKLQVRTDSGGDRVALRRHGSERGGVGRVGHDIWDVRAELLDDPLELRFVSPRNGERELLLPLLLLQEVSVFVAIGQTGG